jgi:hypothetical protein
LNKYRIKLAFNLSNTKPIYTTVHLCAPKTYDKQDKKLYDSKIYNFKHEGYQKVKCISKELRYRNKRGDAETTMYPEVHTLASVTSVGVVWSHKGSPNTTKASPYSPRAFPPKGNTSIHYGTLRVVTEPAQSLGLSPQLNWRLPTYHHKGLTLE